MLICATISKICARFISGLLSIPLGGAGEMLPSPPLRILSRKLSRKWFQKFVLCLYVQQFLKVHVLFLSYLPILLRETREVLPSPKQCDLTVLQGIRNFLEYSAVLYVDNI